MIFFASGSTALGATAGSLIPGIGTAADANDLRAKVFRDRACRGDWRVEKMDEDGGYEVAVFSGGDARARAIRYAGVAASSSTATECELASIIGRSGC